MLKLPAATKQMLVEQHRERQLVLNFFHLTLLIMKVTPRGSFTISGGQQVDIKSMVHQLNAKPTLVI